MFLENSKSPSSSGFWNGIKSLLIKPQRTSCAVDSRTKRGLRTRQKEDEGAQNHHGEQVGEPVTHF